jgi:hypothetical protein
MIKNAVLNLMNGGDAAPASAFLPYQLPSYTVDQLSASNCPGDYVNELDVPNAIELIFKTPYAVPNDRTFAEVTCSTAQIADDATTGATSASCSSIADLDGGAYSIGTSVATNDDTTYATCEAGDAQYWRNDPLHVFQNSVAFSGFGAGNCWYMGRST